MFAALLITGITAKGQTLTLTLADALKLANENNRALKMQRLEQNLAKEKSKEALGNLLPSIAANTNYAYYFDRQVIFMPGSFVGENQQPVADVAVGGKNAFGASLGFYQPIVAEPFRNQLNASKISQEMQMTVTADNESALILDVSTNYYQLLLNEAVIKVYQQSLEHNLKALDDSRMLLKQGKALSIDTLQNFIRAENVKTILSNLESQHKVLGLQLKNRLGLQSEQNVFLLDSLALDNNFRYFSAVEDPYYSSIELRPDIRLQLLNIELSKSKLREAQSYRIPTLAAVAQYNIQMQADNLVRDNYNWPRTSFAGVQLSIPILSGNKINSRVKQSKILFEQSRIKLDDAKHNAKTEIASINAKLKDAVQKLSLNEKIVQSAMQSFNIVSNRYSQGLSSRLELTDAELSLNQAKLNYLQTVFDIKTIKLQLDRATGILSLNQIM